MSLFICLTFAFFCPLCVCVLHASVFYDAFAVLCMLCLSMCALLFCFVCVCCVCGPHPCLQLQEAKQLERERHRQHSPVTQHTEPDSAQHQTHIHSPAKGPTREANGPLTPPTPSITTPSTPSTPSTPAPESSGRSALKEQEEQREQEEKGENPDPENGSEFCVAESEQTEADQATAAAESKAARRVSSFFSIFSFSVSRHGQSQNISSLIMNPLSCFFVF